MSTDPTPYIPATPAVAWDRPVPTLRNDTEPAPIWTPSRAYRDQGDVEALIDAQLAWAQLTPCQQCGRIVAHPEAAWCEPCAVDNAPRMHGYAPEKHTAVYDALAQRFTALTRHRDDLAAEVTRIRGQLAEARCALKRTEKGGMEG